MRKLLIFFVGVFVASAAFAAIVEPATFYETCESGAAPKCENADIMAYVTNTPFSWGDATDAGNVLGIVVCSDISGNTMGYIANSKDTSNLNTQRASWASGDEPTGANCWCKMESPGESSWLYDETFKDVKDCTNSCSYTCGALLDKNRTFLHTMYSTLPPPNPWDVPTTQSTGGCTDGDDKGCNNSRTTSFVRNNIMSWAAEYDRERINIMGVSVCSTPTGVAGDIATTAATTTLNTDRTAQASGDKPTGANCWCKMELPGESSWVLGEEYTSPEKCSSGCSDRCENQATEFGSVELKSMYATMVQPRTVTTQTYVGRIFDALQPKITTTGVNKLMLYGGTAGAILARDIVTTLGNNTNATTVSTTGAVVTGAGTKQDALNGTNGWVATGTSDPVVFGQKPVYDLGAEYIYALTPAQTINVAATDGANSELVCARYVANVAPTPANCLLWELAPYDVGGAAMPDLKRGFADVGECCTQDTDCISYNCGDNNLCEDNDLKVTYIGGRCSKDPECVSGFCNFSVAGGASSGKHGICTPVGCTAGGGNCNNDRDCCSGVCNGGQCTTARAAGYYCGEAANCASGNCTNGQCTKFLPDGAECENDAECISTSHCVNGRCRGDCAIAEESCSVDADCCSGVCRLGSIVGEYVCADACATVGNACSSDSDCCGYNKCTNGTCTATGMNGDPCDTTADCWNGWCNKGTCTAGRADLGACTANEQCLDKACSGGGKKICNGKALAKYANGESCDLYNNCASYFCRGGVCVGAPTGAVCTENSNCASGICTDGVCTIAIIKK